MDILMAVVSMLTVIVLYKYLQSKRWSPKGIPGPTAYPIIGSALQVKPGHIHHMFYKFAQQYGKMFAIQLFDEKIVVLNTTEVINKAFRREGQSFSHRPNIFIGDYIDVMDSISFRNPDKEHRVARKSFVKGLHLYGSGIPRFETIIQVEIDRLIKQIEDFDGQQFEVVGLIRRSIINVMSILLIGEEATDEDVELFSEYTAGTDFFMNALTSTTLSHLPVLLHLPYYKRKMHKVTQAKLKLQEKYFYRIKESMKSENINGLVEWFLHDQKESEGGDSILSDQIIKSINLTDILTAGVLTSSSVLPSIILSLVNHPENQTQLQAEIDKVIGNNREPTISDKHDCQFIEAVIMESMRYLTPVPFLLPHACYQDTDFEGVNIKANTQVLANVWFVHHDENIWGDPWTFRPERFLDENGKILSNDHINMKSWMPFGTGRRGCPGRGMATTRMFMYLASIFKRFTLMPVPGRCGSCDPRSDNFVCELIMKPKPFYCYATTRN